MMSFTQSRKSLHSGLLRVGIPSFTKFLDHPMQSQAPNGDVQHLFVMSCALLWLQFNAFLFKLFL